MICRLIVYYFLHPHLVFFFFFQMHAELQLLSPLVPVREVRFLRFCKQLIDGAWAIVDVSVDATKGDELKCLRLPSGCVVQDTSNGYSKARKLISSSFLLSLSSRPWQLGILILLPPSRDRSGQVSPCPLAFNSQGPHSAAGFAHALRHCLIQPCLETFCPLVNDNNH